MGQTRSTILNRSPGRTLAVLHPVFALTGICHSIGGPLLPSLERAFQLNDSQAGFLLFSYYAGTSVGALLCGRRHARDLTLGFAALALAGVGVTLTNRAFLFPAFLIFGVAVGVPMTAVTMHAGRVFGARSAAPLTLLNFSWSVGGLVAPLLAARLLLDHSFRMAYAILAGAAFLAALACWMLIEDAPAQVREAEERSSPDMPLIVLFALLTFLQVGVENTSASWLTTYVLRTSATGTAMAAASSSIYWSGFLVSRGLSSLVLIRVEPGRMLGVAAGVGIAAAVILVAIPENGAHVIAMVILGVALAPIFPLLLARFFARVRNSADSRWVLSLCGFGGSVLPWITGSVSAATGSLRLGLVVIPAALAVILAALPLSRSPKSPLSAD